VSSLNADQKAKLNEFWMEFSGNRPKPQQDTATVADLTALSEEAIRLSFNAEYVDDDDSNE